MESARASLPGSLWSSDHEGDLVGQCPLFGCFDARIIMLRAHKLLCTKVYLKESRLQGAGFSMAC